MIMAQGVFLAASGAEGGDAFEVTNHAGGVVDIIAVADRAGGQGVFVDVCADVADGDAHVDAEVLAAGGGGDIEQLPVLRAV